MKFADLTHAIKPHPATDVPQAAAAHDSLWDWVAKNQESAHMIMWLMSMRGAAPQLANDAGVAHQHLPAHL